MLDLRDEAHDRLLVETERDRPTVLVTLQTVNKRTGNYDRKGSFALTEVGALRLIADLAAWLDQRRSGGRSGFRPTDMGALLIKSPIAASAELKTRLAAAGGNVSQVARDLDVTYKTLGRWLEKLAKKGLDPRASK